MATEFRKTGISVVGDAPWGTHFCHFYETKQDLLDTLVPYFKAGLERKEFCLWVVSAPELITMEEARTALAQAVPDLDRHMSDENIEILNGHEWYLQENVFDFDRVTRAWDAKLKRALARGHDGMRAAADTFWLAEKDWKDLFAYERQLTDWITDQPMTVMCTYPLAKSGATEVLDVVQAHQFAIARRQGKWEVVESPEPIQARAEIKRLNEELQRVPDGMPERPAIVRYGVAVLSVIAEVVVLWLMDTNLQAAAHISLCLCAVIFSTCFGGIRPGLLAILLSILAFDYVLPPSDSLAVNISHLPRLLLFAPLAFFVAWLIAAQQSKAESLRHARDVLHETVQELKRTNVALQAENAERKRSEDALRQSEERFAAFMDNLPGYAWMKDLQGRYVYVNEMVRGLPGYRSLGKTDAQIWPADLAAEYRANDQQVIAAKKPLHTLEHFQLEGKHRYMAGSKFPIFDKTGAVALVGGVGVDITERIEAEEAVRRSEDRNRLIIDTIPTMAWSLEPEGAIDFVNQRWMDYTGLSLEQAIAEPTRPMHPEDLPGAMAEWGASRAAGEPFEGEIRLRRADGEYRWFLVRTDPLRDDQGNFVKWYGAAIDIEDRKRADAALKESQRRLEEAQRIGHVGHWDRDMETARITWSDEIYRILGLPLEERDSPRTEWLDVVHPEDRQRVSLAIEELERGIRRFDVEFRIVRPNGEVRFLHSQGDVIHDERGLPVRRLGTAQDITESKCAEEQLKATTEQLRALSARLQSAKEQEGIRIARELHDELGSELSSLRWDLEDVYDAISKFEDRSQIEESLQKMTAMMRLAETTINNVRRISSELRPIALDDLGLTDAIEWQARQFQERTGIMVECDCTLENVDLTREQSTAAFRISQEALTNILRHAQATKVHIQLNKENGDLVLTISDNGRGITESEKSGQSTLGLLGMRERAHLVGGKIDIAGSKDKGTLVTLRFPIVGAGLTFEAGK